MGAQFALGGLASPHPFHQKAQLPQAITQDSGISRKKFEKSRPLLENVRQRTALTTGSLYQTFFAVLYLQRTGQSGEVCAQRFSKIAQSAIVL